jgi:hypothetical protein
MKNPNITNSHSVSNEVQVNLHMLRPLMLNRVGELHDADVVAVDECALGERVVKLSKPGRLSHAVSNSPVRCLSTRATDNWLSLRRPGRLLLRKTS